MARATDKPTDRPTDTVSSRNQASGVFSFAEMSKANTSPFWYVDCGGGTERCTRGLRVGQTDGRTDRWMDRRTDGQDDHARNKTAMFCIINVGPMFFIFVCGGGGACCVDSRSRSIAAMLSGRDALWSLVPHFLVRERKMLSARILCFAFFFFFFFSCCHEDYSDTRSFRNMIVADFVVWFISRKRRRCCCCCCCC